MKKTVRNSLLPGISLLSELINIIVMKTSIHMTEDEASIEELRDILSPIYTSGYSVEEYKRALLYLSSLSLKENKNKKKVMDNWTIPFIEALLLFLKKLEKNEELMEAAKNYLKN